MPTAQDFQKRFRSSLARRLRHRRLCIDVMIQRIFRYGRQASIPFKVRGLKSLELLRLPVSHVSALSRVAREVVEELVAVDREVFPVTRAHSLLVPVFHTPIEFALHVLSE